MHNKPDGSSADRAGDDNLPAVRRIHDAEGADFKLKAHQLSPASGMNHIAAAMKITGSASQGII